MKTQQAVVQYALAPMSVELREIPVPEIGPSDVLLAVGAVSVCGSDVHQAYGTHSWPVNIPVALGHEFGGTVAAAGHDVQDFREGDRVVSETAAVICGACSDVPHRPLQPVPDAQGLRLRRQRRDGPVRESARPLPAPRARLAAVRAGLPDRAALGRV